MRYSYEFKRSCIEMYRQGILPDIPDGISKEQFQRYIRRWMRMEESQGYDVLKHKVFTKKWSPEEKLELVVKALNGNGIQPTALEAGINPGMLYQWVLNYKIYGYNGLIPKQKGRKPKDPNMKKVGTRKPPKPNESEYEELIRLRAENEYMKAEIEVIKKEIALREEKEAARLNAKKQQSSRNSGKKDTN
ncbi:MAG: helix-turn-helix domain-containing protein [Lachnospiraceae bacterium]|nr:helix-turn-helix domain-containing protein [Lachnospiraceae bacterium]